MRILSDIKQRNFFRMNFSSSIIEQKIEYFSFGYMKIQILSVYNSLREIGVVKIQSKSIPDIYSTIKNNNLQGRFFQIDNNSFNHFDIPIDFNDEIDLEKIDINGASIIGIIGKNISSIDTFINFNKFNDYANMGKQLGYPACCNNFLVETHLAGIIDPIWQMATNTKSHRLVSNNHIELNDYYPELNPLLRHLGIGFIPYIPHALDCEASLDLIKSWKNLADAQLGTSYSKELLASLSTGADWSVNKGIGEAKNQDIKLIYNSTNTLEKYSVSLKSK